MGGRRSPKTFFQPFGPQFGLKIRGAGVPRAPPLDPPPNCATLDQQVDLKIGLQARKVYRSFEKRSPGHYTTIPRMQMNSIQLSPEGEVNSG